MITDGVDLYGTGEQDDPNVTRAIEHAQTSGIQVFTIYTGSGTFRRGLFPGREYWALPTCTNLSDQTGAEAYNSGLSPAVSSSRFWTI